MVLVIEVAVLLAGCGREGERGGPAGKPPSETSPQQPPEGTRKPAAEEPGQRPAVQRFSGTIGKIPSRNTVKYSWRPGCPVPLSRLRLLRMTYWGFDRRTHTGEMVVNARVADDVVKVFRRLYDQRYPVRRMQLVDVYKGSDFASIDADNTSAFNCRAATGSSSWSQHAYGLAIDVNPCENPYVTGSGQTAHKHCRKHVDRARRNPGVIRAGDKTVRAFRSIGWGWGGAWSGTKDYQHFSSNGR
ncbi:M15 family metallopeptidase [Actinomadura alba]|uniref:M15 family metallopeptidase n=2 Tax=Actinomadura alba TaxID=406431 RepID=A0ABR7LPS4_9ACTN|nr:M15 family metallopeptidase [Actinomadura alba]